MSTISASTTSTTAYKVTADTTGTLVLQTGSTPTTAVTIDTAQNMGLGVTPSAWGTYKAFQLNSAGYSMMGGTSGAIFGALGVNYYFDGTNYKYINASYATQYNQSAGAHTWSTAGIGSAGANITFTQAMTLDASGQLQLGTTSNFLSLTREMSMNAASGTVGISMGVGGTLQSLFYSSTSATYVGTNSSTPLVLQTGGSERARIDSSGNLLVGATSGSPRLYVVGYSGGRSIAITHNGGNDLFYSPTAGVTVTNGESGTNAAFYVTKASSTNRSINAAGTVNASGADYAEYMTKAGDFTIAKGDVVGINAEGKLTNVFSDAVSFVVKSTDPSYVGGDVWGSDEALGLTCPEQPLAEATDEEKAQYETDKAAFESALEAARQLVDRIAFAGQVPVNVTGATAGQYIVPVNDNGAIKGEAVSNPTFEQYQQAVGKVIAIEQDGRARIIVKVA